MKSLPFLSIRLDLPEFCLIAALAGACSSNAIKLPDSAPPALDGAGVLLPDAGASGSGGTSTNSPDVPTATGGSGGTNTNSPDVPTATGGSGGTTSGGSGSGGTTSGGSGGFGGSGGNIVSAPDARTSTGGSGSFGGSGGNTTSPPDGPTATGGGGTAGGTGGLSGGSPAADASVAGADGGGGVPASADANCGIQTINLSQLPADLLLLVDRSGSMNNDIATDASCSVGGRGDSGTCTARWPAITTSLNQVLSTSPPGVQWGLKFFTSPAAPPCTVNPGADVPVGPDTAAEIQTAIAGTTPANQTPTTAAINATVDYFSTVDDGLPHYILLATDGQPNCDPGTSSVVSATSVANTAAAIAAAAALGIKTYVVGIGPSVGNLDNFAQAGGTGTYFPATSPEALTAAFSSIAVTVASCVFAMGAVPPDLNNLGVYLGETTKVPRDPSDGYSLGANNRTVTFNGSYCDGIKNGTYKLVQVFFGCASGPPPPDALPTITPARLSFTPSVGTFSTPIGTTSASIAFNLANTGGSASDNLAAALGGPNASEFAIVDNRCLVPLAPSTTCAITVVFKPTGAGAKTATLTVADSTASSTSATATLNGVGVGLSLAITGSQNLGSVVVGQSGTASTYTVTNTGGIATGALTVVSGDTQFAIGSDLCSGVSLAAAGTCTFTVTFRPTSVGVKAAVLSVSSGGTLSAALQIQATGVPVAADAGP